MNRIAAVAFASVLASTAQADQNSAFQDAKSFAGGKTQGVFTGISSGAVADKIPGYGANPSETQFFQGGQGALSGPGVTKMQNCASYAPGQNKIANQECEAVNFLARNPEVRPQFNIGSNDPIVISAKEARKNAESLFQTLDINGGAEGSTQCTTKTTTTPTQYTTETCTSLRAVEGQQCTIGRKVDIDADANYQCDKTLTAFTSQERQPTVSTPSCTYGRQVNIDADSNFQCDKTLTAFTSQERLPVVSTSSCTYGRQVNIDEDSRFQCDQTVSAYETLKCKRSSSITCIGGGDGCDAGGIVANSWEGDMAVKWEPSGSGDFNLTFGTIADNYWGGWGATYDRTLSFQVKDKALITKFALTRAAFDDWLWVKVNDNTVYVGPYGGDRLYVISQGNPIGGNSFCYQNDWSGQWVCYQYTAWSETPTQVGSYAYCSCVGWDGCSWYCNNDGIPGRVKYGASDVGWPELSTSWNFSLNIDIKPYLREGLNTVWMRTIVAGGGEGAAVFTTRQVCPTNCSVTQNNQCAALEARSQ